METVEQRVAADAAWLDENEPGWVAKIDPETLDIAHAERCVLGQVYGDFYDAPSEVRYGIGENGWTVYVADAYGFDGLGFTDLAALTEAWRQLLAARR